MWGEPYHCGYNSTDLRELAECICSLADWDWALEDYSRTPSKILKALHRWERDFIFIVEEDYEPFEAEWDYWGDDRGHNFSESEILQYAKTRNDLWKYDDDYLINFVWGYKDKKISEILDEFSYIDWKDDLFDHLNNILFHTFDEVVEEVKRWCEEHSIRIDTYYAWEYANQFIDANELYDLDYSDKDNE